MGLMFLLNLVILIVFIVMGTRTWRDKILNGTISYGRALLVAMLIVAFSTIIGSIYTFVFNMFIDPEYVNKVFEATKSSLYDSLSNMGLPDAQIEQSIDRIEKQQAEYTPMKSVIQSITYSLIFGFVVSLITSAFVAKTPKPVA
jgi:uncharacterized membrane protein